MGLNNSLFDIGVSVICAMCILVAFISFTVKLISIIPLKKKSHFPKSMRSGAILEKDKGETSMESNQPFTLSPLAWLRE